MVGNGGAEKFLKVDDNSTLYIQQFQIHFQNKQQNFEVILEVCFNLSVSETFSPGSHSSKGAQNFQKGAPDLLKHVEGGATAPSCPP